MVVLEEPRGDLLLYFLPTLCGGGVLGGIVCLATTLMLLRGRPCKPRWYSGGWRERERAGRGLQTGRVVRGGEVVRGTGKEAHLKFPRPGSRPVSISRAPDTGHPEPPRSVALIPAQ